MLPLHIIFGSNLTYNVSAAELVGPKYRVYTSVYSSTMFALGQVTLGVVAGLVRQWRYMLMVLHIPCFLVLGCYFFLSESVRWLLAKQKYTEARTVLEKVARVNKTHISEKSMQALMTPPPQTTLVRVLNSDYSIDFLFVIAPIYLYNKCFPGSSRQFRTD